MENLFVNAIKFGFMFPSVLYIYAGLLRISLHKKTIFHLPVWIILAFTIAFSTKELNVLQPFAFLLIAFLYLLIAYRKPLKTSVSYSFISVGICFFLLTISYLITLPITFAFSFIDNVTLSLYIMTVIIGIIQLVLSIVVFKIKRFKNGLMLTKNDNHFSLLIVISAITISVSSLFYTEFFDSYYMFIIFFVVSAIGAVALLLWNAVLADRYKSEIYKRNVAIYEKTLAEYESRNKNIADDNSKLSAVIHRDNKFISVMELAVADVLNGKCDKKSAGELLKTLEELSSQRKELIRDCESNKDTLPKTGDIAIDSTLIYVRSVAKNFGVDASFDIDDGFIDTLQNLIDMTHFNTLLCDICENAIHAAETAPDGKIFLSMKIDNDFPAVTIKDNGAPFDEKVLSSIGRIRITTRKNKGGSGIGLVYIFEILQKYGASFCLDEIPDGSFAKSITLRFDSRARLEVNTNRPNVAKAFKNRTTIYD